MVNIEHLNQTFALHKHINFTLEQQVMPVVKVENKHATATISLQGAHVLGFQNKGQKPLIWMSEDARLRQGKSLRGGIPVCSPWFGSHPTDATKPAHGYARTGLWLPVSTSALADGSHKVVLQLQQADNKHTAHQEALVLRLTVTIGKTLKLTLETTNLDNTGYELSEALHTYFYVGDVRKVFIEGFDGCTYLDKAEGFKQKTQQGVITVSSEVDRIYLHKSAQDKAHCCIIDPDLQRKIHVHSQHSGATVVWNPWRKVAVKMGDLGKDGYLNMLCVETANAADASIMLQSGMTHSLNVEYSIVPFNEAL